ncbi:hypothetical protein G9A89_017287 [Geosiphon pyriformis]|nr:hypothetical protein G9A89_017287 [Geosiphon pyriformis]
MPQGYARLRSATVYIEIPKIHIRAEGFLGLRKYAEYEISTKYISDRDGWAESVSYLRYSQIRAYRKLLRSHFPRFLCGDFPKKKMFGLFSPSFLKERAGRLKIFLIQLVQSFGDVDIIIKFLGIDLYNLTPGQCPLQPVGIFGRTSEIIQRTSLVSLPRSLPSNPYQFEEYQLKTFAPMSLGNRS